MTFQVNSVKIKPAFESLHGKTEIDEKISRFVIFVLRKSTVRPQISWYDLYMNVGS